jgi:hypothetical protein
MPSSLVLDVESVHLQFGNMLDVDILQLALIKHKLQFGYLIVVGLSIRDFCHQGFGETTNVAMHHL